MMNDQQQNKSSSLEVLMPIQKQLSEKVKSSRKLEYEKPITEFTKLFKALNITLEVKRRLHFLSTK